MRCRSTIRYTWSKRMSDSPVPLRILYVEDNDLVRDITHEILSQPSRTVVAVASAEEALKVSEPDAFDVVVTDVSLPAMSGMDLARQLLRRAPAVPIIIATG